MAMKREDYAELGIQDARRAHAREPVLHMPTGSKTTWQTKAYDDAFAAEMARLEDEDLAKAKEATKALHGAREGGKATGAVQFTGKRPFAGSVPNDVLAADTAAWPAGAKEHARLLNERIRTLGGTDRNPTAQRMRRALIRLCKRHAQTNQPKAPA